MNDELFERKDKLPLALRMRPQRLIRFVGQQHILSPDSFLFRAIKMKQLKSLILYGPPGCGKTTLALIVKNEMDAYFEPLNAVIDKVETLRRKILDAKNRLKYEDKRTILFIDEIYRFNKAQQDVLLPWLEDETVILIGTTTLNPFFYLSKALLSRVNVLELKPLTYEDIKEITMRALEKYRMEKALDKKIILSAKALAMVLNAAQGDARMALNILEQALDFVSSEGATKISEKLISEIVKFKGYRFDVKGDEHYAVISAFIKSMRGTDPDAAIYWLARMLESGEDIRFITRRLLIFASEDIGNADPLAAILASSITAGIERVGLPEAKILLAQITTYLASAPKSNASYEAIEKSIADVKHKPLFEVPEHLRNFNFEGMNKTGNSPQGEKAEKAEKDKYKYPHNYKDGWVNQTYMPVKKEYYSPKNIGFEKKINERLDAIKKLKESGN